MTPTLYYTNLVLFIVGIIGNALLAIAGPKNQWAFALMCLLSAGLTIYWVRSRPKSWST